MRNEQIIPQDYPDRIVCVIGLGFVGLTLATTLADIGFSVIGVEIRKDLITQLISGDAHFFEPGLSTKLKKVLENGSLQISQVIPDQCQATVYIVTAGTPIDGDKKINLTSIINISNDLASHLKEGDLVILRSTVKLGTTRSIVFPILQTSGKKFQLAFCPERTVEGQAMTELRFLPQIIGTNALETSLRTAQLFQFLTPTVIRVNDWETAEMIKLIDNTKRDVIFGFANEVARLCDAVGLSAEEVISAGRFGYSRTDLPIPGPVGGPCLSKDAHILIQSMSEYNILPEITIAARKTNEEQPLAIIHFLKDYLKTIVDFPKQPVITLLGIAFKGRPATDDLRGTTAAPIFAALKAAFPNALFLGYDPVVKREELEKFGIHPKSDLQDAMTRSNLVLILNNHPLFSTMQLEHLTLHMAKPGIVYDFWNNFHPNNLSLPSHIQYIPLGGHKYAIRD